MTEKIDRRICDFQVDRMHVLKWKQHVRRAGEANEIFWAALSGENELVPWKGIWWSERELPGSRVMVCVESFCECCIFGVQSESRFGSIKVA
jgi:hypothetical protein